MTSVRDDRGLMKISPGKCRLAYIHGVNLESEFFAGVVNFLSFSIPVASRINHGHTRRPDVVQNSTFGPLFSMMRYLYYVFVIIPPQVIKSASDWLKRVFR